jgi:hypothetical protein
MQPPELISPKTNRVYTLSGDSWLLANWSKVKDVELVVIKKRFRLVRMLPVIVRANCFDGKIWQSKGKMEEILNFLDRPKFQMVLLVIRNGNKSISVHIGTNTFRQVRRNLKVLIGL